MKTTWQLVAMTLLCSLCSCVSPPAGERLVRQRIPIEIQSGKTVTVDIHPLSGNGPNDVGIRCLPEVWNSLTNGTKSITVRLKSSNKNGTNLYGANAGGTPAGFLYLIPGVYYLFEIGGDYHAKASVEITFPNAPTAVTHAEIIVCDTPADRGF